MNNNTFTFKQFTIHQQHCAIKVGTDGVLLGAWASNAAWNQHPGAPGCMLDIGTGTGLIALMLAQRFPNATIDAIDIEPDACQQARQNVLASPFSSRISIVEASLQNLSGVHRHPERRYNIIAANPPYFINSLHAPDTKRTTARHAATLSYRDLAEGVATWLADDGEFSVILPTQSKESMIAECLLKGLLLTTDCTIRTVAHKLAKRCMLSFRKKRMGDFVREERLLQNSDGTRSEWYTHLTREFYLDKY